MIQLQPNTKGQLGEIKHSSSQEATLSLILVRREGKYVRGERSLGSREDTVFKWTLANEIEKVFDPEQIAMSPR